ncbi:MAG: hypothetical protein AAF468_21875 [Pseudomonadota bacterium]
MINSAIPFPTMKRTYQEQHEWLESLIDRLGITASELARRAKLNPSTLTRFLNSEQDEGHALSFRTMRKIESAVVLPSETRSTSQILNAGLGEQNAIPFDMENHQDAYASAVRALIGTRNACDPWRIVNGDLEGIGLYPGDILVVDLNAQPQAGDIVCAQLYEPGSAKTVFRLYEPPYLLSQSTDPKLRRPVVVDNTNATIRGTVIARLSPRFSTSKAA